MDLYFLCNQTITLYHICKIEKIVCRTVIENGAYFENRCNYKLEKLGLGASTSPLVVIPLSKTSKTYMPPNEFKAEFQENNFTISAGDIIIPGICPDVSDSKDIITLTPLNYPEMITVSSISPVRGFDGVIGHIEVG